MRGTPCYATAGDEDRVNWIGRKPKILDGVGHIPDIEAPDRVNQLFGEFFR